MEISSKPEPNRYVIDWDKVRTLDDIKRLLRSLEIVFVENFPNLEQIRDLVRPKDDERR